MAAPMNSGARVDGGTHELEPEPVPDGVAELRS